MPGVGRKPSLKAWLTAGEQGMSAQQAAQLAARITQGDEPLMGQTGSGGSRTPRASDQQCHEPSSNTSASPDQHQSTLDKVAGAASLTSLNMNDHRTAGSLSPGSATNASQQRATLERRIEIGGAAGPNVMNNIAFPSNYVSTTKYELWNIVPKNLWEQFHRVANVWFLIVSIFQMLPLSLSPTNQYATFFPLCCVLFLTFCKDAYEDYGRRREDRHVNNQVCMVVDSTDPQGEVKPVKWKDVSVGSFLLIRRDEPVPADLVLIASSNEDGVAYLDTVQLDGESSLKPKFALEETMRITETREVLGLHGRLDTEPPNELVQSFSGTLYLQGFPRGVPIDAKSFLLRGSTIRNTAWVYGLVVFTGVDTKIVQNLRKTPSKRSRVEVTANVLLMIVFGLLMFAAAVSAFARALYVASGTVGADQVLWAWPEPDPLRDNDFLAFITFMIGYNNLIPISLYVTTDLARTFQGIRMELDSSMYHAETESSCKVKNSGLNEDLGQIEFVLTDKTGTLTENRMEFKACSIGGKVYGRWCEHDGPVDYVAAVPPQHICQPLSARALVGHKWASSATTAKPASSDKMGASTPSQSSSGVGPRASVYGKWDEEKGIASPKSSAGGSISTASACAAAAAAGTSSSSSSAAAAVAAAQRADGRSLSRALSRTASRKSTMFGQKEVHIDQFFMCLASCHTAIVEQMPSRNQLKGSPSSNSAGISGSPSLLAVPGGGTPATAGASGTVGAAGSSGACCTVSLPVPSLPGQFSDVMHPPTDAATKGASISASSGSGGEVDFAGVSPRVSTPAISDDGNGGLIVPSNDEKFEELIRQASRAAFRSSSPDEEALVSAARDYGFFFRRKVASRLTINVRGRDQYYQVLICNEFTSERKRMSVLIQRVDAPTAHEGKDRRMPDPRVSMIERNITPSATFNPTTVGNLPDAYYSSEESDDFSESGYPAVLYAKGADNVMLERLNPSTQGIKLAKRHMKNFASQGLRTLILAKRELTPNEVDNFVRKMNEARGAFMNRDSMMETVANEMERDFQLLGVTAVEDRIQEGVPETVNMLLRAGVKVWMLTGDNMETAINIGLACKLVEPSMRLYKLDASGDCSPEGIWKLLDAYYTEISRQLSSDRENAEFKYCLVLHGKVLYTIMEEEQVRLRQLFLAIACSSCSVVACRLAPAQKAALVKLVRGSVVGNPVTLAIGDGGNDASMIQEANVGVGILGVEGRQAANAADFTIGQFRFLQNLLFVHGRWNLRRISIIIGYSFYKNFLLVLPLAFYAPFNGFSGTPLYESYLLATFNLAFTAAPILIFGIFDIDICAEMALLVPSLYELGIDRKYFNFWMLNGWIARGVLHAVFLFSVMSVVISGWPAGGPGPDQLVMGSWAYWACVSVSNVILLVHTRAWMDWSVFVLLASVLFFVPVLCLYSDSAFFLSSMFEPQMVGVASVLFGNARSLLGLFLVTAGCGLSDLAVLFCRKMSSPDVADILQEVQMGYLSGTENIPGEAWASLAEGGAKAEDILRLIPSPAPRVHQVRPEGRVGLKPLRIDKKSRSGMSWRKSDDWKLDSVVPLGAADQSPKSDAHNMNSNSIITYPESFLERFRFWLMDKIVSLWKRQWCEMTVTELAGGLGYDRIEVSKHFKSAIRSSASEGGRALEKDASGGRRSSLMAAFGASDAMKRGSSTPWSPVGSAAGTASPSSAIDDQSRREVDPIAAQQSLITSEGNAQSSMDGSHEVVQDLRYSILTLRFLSAAQEAAYQKFSSKQAANLFRTCLASFVFATFMWFFYELLILHNASTSAMLIALGCLPGSAMIAWFLRSQAFESRAEWIIVAVVTAGIISKHGYDLFEDHTGLLFNAYFPVFIIAGLRVRFTFITLVLAFHMMAVLVRYWLVTIPFPLRDDQALLTSWGQLPAEYFMLMSGITCLAAHYSYMLEKISRKDYFVLDSIFRSKNQALEILNGMFPREVVDHVLMKVRKEEGMRKLQEDCGIVTILFCDIFDFDGITQSLKPMELVQLLDLVWMLFDRLCERYGTVKIETVGKTYMAAAMPPDGINATVEQHAKDASAAVLTAIGMLGLVSKRFTGIGAITHVSVRIGIHTGRALSGVVGSTKPQFALFGDTVNTASRMQSTGKSGCLHVSSSTYDLLRDDPQFEWRAKKTEVKGKGLMDTYFLTKYHSEMEDSPKKSKTPRSVSSREASKQHPASEAASSTSNPNSLTLGSLPNSSGSVTPAGNTLHSLVPPPRAKSSSGSGSSGAASSICAIAAKSDEAQGERGTTAASGSVGASSAADVAASVVDGGAAVAAEETGAGQGTDGAAGAAAAAAAGADGEMGAAAPGGAPAISQPETGELSEIAASACDDSAASPKTCSAEGGAPGVQPGGRDSSSGAKMGAVSVDGPSMEAPTSGSQAYANGGDANSQSVEPVIPPLSERHDSRIVRFVTADPPRSPSKNGTSESGHRTLGAEEKSPSAVSSREMLGGDQSESGDQIQSDRVDLNHDVSAMTTENLEVRGMMLTYFAQPQAGNPAKRVRRQSSMMVFGEKTRLIGSLCRNCPFWWRKICHSCGGRDANATMRMRGAALFSQWVSFVAFWCCFSAESLCVIFGEQASNRAIGIGSRVGFMLLGLAFSIGMYNIGNTSRWGVRMSSFGASIYSDCIAFMAFTAFVCAFASNTNLELGDARHRAFWMVFEGFFFVMGQIHLCRLNPQGLVPLVLCVVTILSILTYVGIVEQDYLGNQLFLEALGSALFCLMMHTIGVVWDPRRTSADHKSICEEHERVSELLDSMLPKEVLAEMKSGNLSLAYSYEDMTFLFADIVGFTRYCATHSAEQAVHLVTRLFAEFDTEAVRLSIYKVCTIGDAYVVVNEPRTQLLDKYSDCESVFNMAKYMLQIISRVRDEVNHADLDMRIGLHVGRFVGGVIGTKRLRFDVWGEDVLVGNSVESHGIAGKICVSQSARDVLRGNVPNLDFVFNQDIPLKTGRVVRTYVCKPMSGYDDYLT